MEIRGTVKGLTQDYGTRKITAAIEVSEGSAARLEELKGKDLKITLTVWREKRSKDANALLWACLSDIARVTGGTKEERYLDALRRYGQYTMVSVKPEAFNHWKAQWRECEVVGERNGMLDVLCYFGSSQYDVSEFALLLDGVIEDMRQAGIDTPLQTELQEALDAWERRTNEQSKKNHRADD